MTHPQDQNRSLATLVREHVAHDEPPFLLSAETSIALGRRTLVRRRARRGRRPPSWRWAPPYDAASAAIQARNACMAGDIRFDLSQVSQ